MSQPRGRYPGPRNKGGHPTRQPSTTSHRQNKPYVKSPPARDAAQTASIFKTRSFKWLVDTVGAENIALGLDSNLSRVAELIKGERFTPETAFHMENTLGLPHGFFDQPNPALADEIITRLKSPLDFVQTDEGFDADSEVLEPVPARTVDQPPVPEDSLSEEAQMPKKIAGGSPRAVKNSRSEMREQPKPRAPHKAPRSKGKASPATPQQQPLALSDSADVENIRRANLRLITSRNGSKVRLGVVMEMSGFNIADRLHGKKRMDSAETNRFTERLGLPAGWLDTLRTEAEIPDSVSRMLAPGPRGRASPQQLESTAPATNDGVQGKRADRKVRTTRERATALDDSSRPSSVSKNVAEDKETIVVSPRTQVNEFPDDLASGSFETDEGSLSATSAPSESIPESLSVSPTPQPNPAPPPFTSTTSLDDLRGIAPIAEALIKTLAGKARTGRLDELKALELLQQAVLL